MKQYRITSSDFVKENSHIPDAILVDEVKIDETLTFGENLVVNLIKTQENQPKK